MKTIFKFLAVILIAFTVQSCNLTSAAGLTSQGQPTKSVDGTLTSTTANSSVNVDHSNWDKLLKKHVNKEGLVDYKGFINDRSSLNSYLQKLASYDPSNDWSVQELLAYYINLYNASTIELILDNYPTKSIQDISGAFTKGFIQINKKELSLGAIENGVLRKMNEPRVHFALNCASISCPKLQRDAYTAGKINEQLDKAATEFINSDKNELTGNVPKVSSIFDFYTKDFEPGIAEYINKYSDTKIDLVAPITFKEYNWSLNEQK